MNSKKQEDKNKKLLRIVRELSDLEHITWNAPLIKLPKPIQIGWVKGLKLRDDCANRKDSHIYRQIMKEIEVTVYCRKQNFIDKKGNLIKAGVRLIRTNEWPKLNWPEHYKKYFYFGLHPIKTYSGVRYDEGYMFVQRFYFVDHITPRFMTHERAKLPEVETRIRELKNFMDNNDGWKSYYHYKKGRSYKDRDYNQPRFDMIDEIADNEIREFLIYKQDE